MISKLLAACMAALVACSLALPAAANGVQAPPQNGGQQPATAGPAVTDMMITNFAGETTLSVNIRTLGVHSLGDADLTNICGWAAQGQAAPVEYQGYSYHLLAEGGKIIAMSGPADNLTKTSLKVDYACPLPGGAQVYYQSVLDQVEAIRHLKAAHLPAFRKAMSEKPGGDILAPHSLPASGYHGFERQVVAGLVERYGAQLKGWKIETHGLVYYVFQDRGDAVIVTLHQGGGQHTHTHNHNHSGRQSRVNQAEVPASRPAQTAPVENPWAFNPDSN